MLIKIRKAQSTLEYALLITVVVGALLAKRNYLKRRIQGRMQIIGDQMGDQYTPKDTYREENMAVKQDQIIENTIGGINSTTNTNITGGRQEMNSFREVGPLENETW